MSSLKCGVMTSALSEVLFKDLNDDEFDVIWNRIDRSYFTEDITYTKVALGNGICSGTLPEPPGSDSY